MVLAATELQNRGLGSQAARLRAAPSPRSGTFDFSPDPAETLQQVDAVLRVAVSAEDVPE